MMTLLTKMNILKAYHRERFNNNQLYVLSVFRAGLQARDICSKLKIYFYKVDLNVIQ